MRDGRSLINSIARLRNRNDAHDTALVALFSASTRLRVKKKKTLNATELPRLAEEGPSVDSDGDSSVLALGGDGVIDSAIQ
jgi:hypothetical protein